MFTNPGRSFNFPFILGTWQIYSLSACVVFGWWLPNSLDTDQDQQYWAWSGFKLIDTDFNFERIFWKQKFWRKISDKKKHAKLPSMQRVNLEFWVFLLHIFIWPCHEGTTRGYNPVISGPKVWFCISWVTVTLGRITDWNIQQVISKFHRQTWLSKPKHRFSVLKRNFFLRWFILPYDFHSRHMRDENWELNSQYN